MLHMLEQNFSGMTACRLTVDVESKRDIALNVLLSDNEVTFLIFYDLIIFLNNTDG